MANEAVQAAIYKLSYDTSAFTPSADVLVQGNEKVIDSFTRVEAKYDPLVRAELRRQAAIQQATRFLEEGVITEDRYKQQLDRVNAAYDAQVTSASAAGQAIANNNRITGEGAIPIERLTHRFTGVAVAVGEFGAGLKSGEALIASFLRSVEFAAMSFGPWGIAIGGVTAAVGALLSSMGVFGTKSKEAETGSKTFAAAQDILANSIGETTIKLGEQGDAIDRYNVKLLNLASSEIPLQGEKVANLIEERDIMAAQVAADAAANGGIANAQAQKDLNNLNARLKNAQDYLQILIKSTADLSKGLQDSAYQSTLLEGSTSATKTNVQGAAAAALELKNNLQDYKDRFNEVMRARVSFSQRLSVMSGTIEDAAKTPPAAASKQTTDAFGQQTEQTRQLEQVTSDLTSTMSELTQSLLVAKDGSIDWAQVTLQGINLVSDAIIAMARLDTGGKGGIAGLLTGLLGMIPGLFAGGGAFPGVPSGFKMAGGGEGVVDRPTLFLAGEAGRERFSFRPMASGKETTQQGDVYMIGPITSNDPSAVEAAVDRAMARRAPGLIKAAADHVIDLRRRGGRMTDAFG